MSKRLAKSLFNGPNLNYINIIRNSLLDDIFRAGPKREFVLNFLVFFIIDTTPVHLLFTNGAMKECNLPKIDFLLIPVYKLTSWSVFKILSLYTVFLAHLSTKCSG